MYKYQEDFANELTEKWLAGDREHVRLKVRQCKDKAQAAYIAAQIAINLSEGERYEADCFAAFLHPNNR
jgi:hypothetical protein